MDSLRTETDAALAGVLSLCTVTHEDVDALQRHDDAALASLEINDVDAAEALKPWIKCLEAWRDTSASGNSEGPWSTITQPCSIVLSNNDENMPPSSENPLAAHKALSVILLRLMLLGSEVQGSPHRAPAPIAWVAARAYLLNLSISGAGAYGILQPAVVGAVLTNIRSCCRNSSVHRPGSGVPSDKGKGNGRGGVKKRGRGNGAGGAGGGESESESLGENDEEHASEGGGSRRSRLAASSSGRGVVSQMHACVRLLKDCLASVPLASHQDLTVKLSEVLVGVSVIAAVEERMGATPLGDIACSVLVDVELATSAGSGDGAGTARGVVLRALMPVILMASGKPDVPPRAKDCFKAHDRAIEIAKEIAIAFNKRNSNALHSSDKQASSEKDPATLSPEAREDPAEKFPGDAGEDPPPPDADTNGKKPGSDSPVLSMVARLCASAPERAEGRAKLAGGIAALLPELTVSDRARFADFLAKFSRNTRISHRGFAVELSSRLITEAWPWAGSGSRGRDKQPARVSTPKGSGNVGKDLRGGNLVDSADGGGRMMLDLVVARAWDRAPTVRSRAVSTLAELLSGIRREPGGCNAREPLREAILEACGWGSGNWDKASLSPREGPLLEVVRTRVQDEKANVRRNAVPALEALLALSPAFGGPRGVVGVDGSEEGMLVTDPVAEHSGDLVLVEERCNDVSVSTRKAAMTALSSLLMSRPGDERLQSAWVRALMPLASDPEQSCQYRLVELVRSVLLDRVVEWYCREVEAETRQHQGRMKMRVSKAVDGGSSAGDGVLEASAGVQPERVSSVWPLLAKAGNGDAHKCLKKVVSLLISQKDSGFKVRPLLKALRSAAVMALPPKASNAAAAAAEDGDGGGEEDAEETWADGDLRLLSLAEQLPQSLLGTIRRGTWVLLEAFLERPQHGDGKIPEGLDMDPMFVVRCWNRTRGHILARAAAVPHSNRGGDGSSCPPSDVAREEFDTEEAFESDGRRVLGVLARLASSVSSEVATPLAERLLDMLLGLVARPETSADLVGALHMLCFAKADSEEAGAAMCNAWANHALSSFEDLLDMFIYSGSGALQDHPGARACGFDMAKLVERLLFSVGEVASVGFTPKEDAAGPSDPQAPGAAAAGPVTVRPSPSPRLVKLVQVLLPPRLPRSAHGVEEGSEGPATPSAVRALAFVTLGHLCMRDKGLAKSSVNILVRELDTADDPAVRSNALVVLGDLCVRYTAMVDRHVGAMAACLQDPHPLVRRHAILLISQLLLQDYVKWRGLLLYRFLATLVDSDASVRSLGAFTLTRPLITKTPGLFAQNFVEALFVLNNYSEHPCYMAAAAGRAEAGGGGVTMDGIDLGGDDPKQVRKRMSVYSIMLEHMSPENKITVTAKLAQEVLSAAVEGGLSIASKSSTIASAAGAAGAMSTSTAIAGPSGGRRGRDGGEFDVYKKASAVVKDALTVMASPAIRVGGGSTRGNGDDLDDGSDEMSSGASGLAAAKSKLLSKVALKHLMETVVPILTALKHVLERAHSPILRELMSYFGEMLRSHKDEVKAVLASEPGLVEEVEFDLRRFEKEEQERRKAKEAAAAAVASLVSACTPSMGPPRTPRGRRSIGGGGVANGRRESSAGPSRAPRTPMAAVIRSARKTPFQNLAECSGVKLKGTTTADSPPLARGVGGGNGTGTGTKGSRPKTPLRLRTPREAVAAALGNSPMAVSPLPMRSVLGDEENGVGAEAERDSSVVGGVNKRRRVGEGDCSRQSSDSHKGTETKGVSLQGMTISISPRSNESEEGGNDCTGKRQKMEKQVPVTTEPPSVELPGKRRSARTKTGKKNDGVGIGDNQTEVAAAGSSFTTQSKKPRKPSQPAGKSLRRSARVSLSHEPMK